MRCSWRGARRALLVGLSSALLSACGAKHHAEPPDGSPPRPDAVGTVDADGDGFTDEQEGAREGRDTDGDGTPDYLDTDSDGNGIDDRTEGGADQDGDGLEDYRDLDDDQDYLPDVQEPGSEDADGDGLIPRLDLDRDGDGILDGHERTDDPDGDGIPNADDLDSDGDGYSDAEEAGDEDVRTPPIDLDGDAIPDFIDPDSDGDCLDDADERPLGTDRTNPDTDGDGMTDLLEVRLGLDPLDPTTTPPAPFLQFELSSVADPVPPLEILRVVLADVPAASGITVRLMDLATDTFDARDYVGSVRAAPEAPGCDALPTADRDGDGMADTYTAASPGDTVCFELTPVRSVGHNPSCCPLLHALEAQLVLAGGGTIVETFTVLFVVPSAFCEKV